jgi:hypothetical protein
MSALQATCPECDGMGVIHASWGFWDGENDDSGVYVRPEKDCPRCKTKGSVFGEEAQRVLAAREVARLRRAKEIPARKIALSSGLMKPSEWCDMEKGLASLEMIAKARAAVEAVNDESGQT